MYTCPHCSMPTISAWRKAGATAARPARCASCGGLSYVAGWVHTLDLLLLEVVFWGAILVAVVLRSWYALLLLPIAVLAVIVAFNYSPHLRITDASSVAVARTRARWEQTAIIAIVSAAYFFFGNR